MKKVVVETLDKEINISQGVNNKNNTKAELLPVQGQLYLSPKFCNNVLFLDNFTTLGTSMNFYWLDHWVECLNVSISNCNLQKGYFFVYHHWGCISIHQPFSLYPCHAVLYVHTGFLLNISRRKPGDPKG